MAGVAAARAGALDGRDRPVERFSAAAHALCAVAVWLLRRRGDEWRSSLALSAVFAGSCMREMDWHKAFTGTSVVRLSWYAGPAPWQTKLIAASVVLCFAAALAWLILRHGVACWCGVRRFEPVAVTVFVFLAVLGWRSRSTGRCRS
jgi:hypothetical protein